MPRTGRRRRRHLLNRSPLLDIDRMAVSNYRYHSQEESPEPFVHWKDPCAQARNDIASVADIVTPLLSDPTILAGIRDEEAPPRQPILSCDDFDRIARGCRDIYRNREELRNLSYYEHLRVLDPREGLRLATADKFNHLALMASDLVLLNQAQRAARQRSARTLWRHRELDLIVMPMDEWIQRPRESMYRFLDFTFRDRMRREKKRNLSFKYEKLFLNKQSTADHVTGGKYADTDELISYLRQDAVFGGPLARIETLLEEALMA